MLQCWDSAAFSPSVSFGRGFGWVLGVCFFKQICIGYESMIVQILTHSALFCGSVHSVENDRIFSVIIKEIP